jgi:hypothetical protein
LAQFVTPIQRLAMPTAPTTLPDDAMTLKAVLAASLAEIERSHQLIAGLQRHRFGCAQGPSGEARSRAEPRSAALRGEHGEHGKHWTLAVRSTAPRPQGRACTASAPIRIRRVR